MENKPTVLSTATRFGLTGALLLIVITFILTLILATESITFNIMSFMVNSTICVGIGIFAIKHYRDVGNAGVIGFSNAFVVSFLSLLIAALCLSFYHVIHYTFIEPEFYEGVLEEVRITYEEIGMDEAATEMAVSWVKIFQSPIVSFLYYTFSYAIGAALISLITGLIMKKEEPQSYL